MWFQNRRAKWRKTTKLDQKDPSSEIQDNLEESTTHDNNTDQFNWSYPNLQHEESSFDFFGSNSFLPRSPLTDQHMFPDWKLRNYFLFSLPPPYVLSFLYHQKNCRECSQSHVVHQSGWSSNPSKGTREEYRDDF